MIQRCINPKAKKFPEYGGRGISFDSRWTSFENFLSDMGERPVGHTLDRKDNDSDYCKDNCRWATDKEQRSNRRSAGATKASKQKAQVNRLLAEVIHGPK